MSRKKSHWTFYLGEYFSLHGEPEMETADGLKWFCEGFVLYLGNLFDEKYEEALDAMHLSNVWKTRFIIASCVAAILLVICILK